MTTEGAFTRIAASRLWLAVGLLCALMAWTASAQAASRDSIAALAAQPDGKIVAAGVARSNSFGLARFQPSGALDSSFGSGGLMTDHPEADGRALALRAAGSAAPIINAGFADHPVEPTRFSPGLSASRPPKALTFTPVNNYVRSIQWSSWGGTEAVGTGRVSLLHGKPGYEWVNWLPEETSPVSVRLGGLRDCLGVKVYSTYSLQLSPGAEAPIGWPRGQQGSFPCRIESATFDGNKSYRSDCPYTGLHPPYNSFGGNPHFQQPRWTPHLPVKRVNSLVFCHLRSRHWGSSAATLTGSGVALLHPFRQNRIWPAKLELLKPTWCPSASYEGPWPGGSAVTYGAIRLTLYGSGEDWSPGNSWPTHLTGVRHVYWQRLKAKTSECLLGIEHRNPRYSSTGHHY